MPWRESRNLGHAFSCISVKVHTGREFYLHHYNFNNLRQEANVADFQPQPDGECHTIPKANIRLPFPILPHSQQSRLSRAVVIVYCHKNKTLHKIGEKLRELSAPQINILPLHLMKSAALCNSSNNEQSVKSESLIGKKGNEYT